MESAACAFARYGKLNDLMNIRAAQQIEHFSDALARHKLDVQRRSLQTLQVNLGKRCNQACSHCHVEAGPLRTEIMERSTIDRLLSLIKNCPDAQTVDITGGAPELNPHFRYFVSELRALDKEVIDRCNLTVLFEPEQEDLAMFLRDQGVQIVASLPCYSRENVDRQRGSGVFDKSVRALQILNGLGFGQTDSGRTLNLVFNPQGVALPPEQGALERDYKIRLREDFGIEFNRLFAIANMPVKRFADALEREGRWDEYMQTLIDNFNPAAAEDVMCSALVSIGWDGKIFDCDFNQMLEIPHDGRSKTVWDIESLEELTGSIAFDNHCYGCTAGAGSSCSGALG